MIDFSHETLSHALNMSNFTNLTVLFLFVVALIMIILTAPTKQDKHCINRNFSNLREITKGKHILYGKNQQV